MDFRCIACVAPCGSPCFNHIRQHQKAEIAVNQETLGVLAGDTSGFPNGRRPGDDVVDIELRVAMGVLLPKADAPSNDLPYTDGAALKATDFRNTFPYLNTPIAGSPSN